MTFRDLAKGLYALGSWVAGGVYTALATTVIGVGEVGYGVYKLARSRGKDWYNFFKHGFLGIAVYLIPEALPLYGIGYTALGVYGAYKNSKK